MTIINIRGTSGSGKTTAVRKLMGLADSIEPLYIESLSSRPTNFRAKPIGYNLKFKELGPPIFVTGHYETPTGGADTIGTIAATFGLVSRKHFAHYHVIFEGLLISRSKGRMLDLWRVCGDKAMQSFHINEPLEVCIASINARRLAWGNTTPVDPEQTTATYNRVLKISNDFRKLQLPIQFVTRDELLPAILRTFGLNREDHDVRPYSPESA